MSNIHVVESCFLDLGWI